MRRAGVERPSLERGRKARRSIVREVESTQGKVISRISMELIDPLAKLNEPSLTWKLARHGYGEGIDMVC